MTPSPFDRAFDRPAFSPTPRLPGRHNRPGNAWHAFLRRCAGSLLAASLWATASAQTAPQPAATATTATTTAACPEAPAHSAQLHGLWQLSLWPERGSEAQPTSRGTLQFQPHPEYPGSVRGQIQRSEAGHLLQAWVSGDLLDGDFNLDESADAVDIDAIWVGQASDCGHTLRGTRLPAERLQNEAEPLQFLMRKQTPTR
jgi:hypothetical protein